MGLYKAFTQQSSISAATSFPKSGSTSEATLGTTPAFIAIARPLGNRRGLIIENDGVNPMVFSLGTTVTVAARTARLDPGDYWEDPYNWQGPVTAMSVSGQANANITELVII